MSVKNTGAVPRVSSFKTNNSGRNKQPVFSDNSIPNPDGDVKPDSLKRDNSTVTPERSSNIYDYTKSFSEHLEDWKQGKIPQRDSLLVSGTPEVLKK